MEETKRRRAEAEKAEAEKLGPLASVTTGDTLIHRSFGAGTVRSIEGSGANMVATIEFDGKKTKRLMLAMAPLSLPE